MGLIKKKAKKTSKKVVEDVPDAPLASVEVVMHNSSQLEADEQGEFCHALFQTEQAIDPRDWQQLVSFAREGARFVITVWPEVSDGEEKNVD